MSTQIFPLTPDNRVPKKTKYRTLISESESGREQRRAKWGAPLRQFALEFRNRAKADADALEAFFEARQGAYDSFYFKNDSEKDAGATNLIEGEVVHAVYANENTSQVAEYPIDAATFKLYEDDVLIDPGDYTLNALTGLVTWVSKPGVGTEITASYDFYYIVRFEGDDIEIERLRVGVYNMKASLQEVRA